MERHSQRRLWDNDSDCCLLYWAKEVLSLRSRRTLQLSFRLSSELAYVVGMRSRPGGFNCDCSDLCILVFLGWVLTRQLLHFAHELPNYRRNIQTRVQSVYGPLASELEKTSRAIQELQDQAGMLTTLRRDAPTRRVEVSSQLQLLQLPRREVGPLFRPLGTIIMSRFL